MRDLFHNHGLEMLKGAVGLLAPMLGVLTSFQENVEYAFRLMSLGGGFLVAILTAISIIRGWKKKP